VPRLKFLGEVTSPSAEIREKSGKFGRLEDYLLERGRGLVLFFIGRGIGLHVWQLLLAALKLTIYLSWIKPSGLILT